MLFGFPFFAIKYTCCWNITDYRYFIVVHAHLEWEWSLKWIFLISLYSVDHSCRKEERKDGEDEREREGWRGRRNATPLYYDTHTHIHPYTIRWVLSTIWLTFPGIYYIQQYTSILYIVLYFVVFSALDECALHECVHSSKYPISFDAHTVCFGMSDISSSVYSISVPYCTESFTMCMWMCINLAAYLNICFYYMLRNDEMYNFYFYRRHLFIFDGFHCKLYFLWLPFDLQIENALCRWKYGNSARDAIQYRCSLFWLYHI